MIKRRDSGARIAEQIRQARAGVGWSQSELATTAGVSRPTIARIEAGQHVRLATLERVASVLGLEVNVQVQWVDE